MEDKRDISGKEEKELKNSMTEVELRQIRTQRQFEDIKKESARFKVGVANDTFAKNCRIYFANIEKAVWNCENIENQKRRKQFELDSNEITSQLQDNVKMTREELELEIKHLNWMKDKDKHMILQELWHLAQLVGKHNIIGEVVLTEKQYEDLLASITKRLEGVGVFLFE